MSKAVLPHMIEQGAGHIINLSPPLDLNALPGKIAYLVSKFGMTFLTLGLAEELLFAALEEDPTDEDALCRLMVLLVEQQRRQEALHLYQYTEDVLQEEQAEPAVYTCELARRIRQGLVLRERGERYTAVRVQTLSLLGQDVVPRDHWDGFGAKRVQLAITAAPCGGQTPTLYRYPPPRRRSRRQVALPVG